MSLLRLAAIDFLNPAPLMWNFEHGADRERLLTRYSLHTMSPAACAEALRAGEAEIGLVPAGAYAVDPSLSILPGSAIASLGSIRSILLVVRASPDTSPRTGAEPDLAPPTPEELAGIHTVALDTASRTSALYTQILFAKYWHRPGATFRTHPAELDAMLGSADAALLIGDPALRALQTAERRERATGERLRYLDLGALWRQATSTAWVSAFWAIRTAALAQADPATLIADFDASREAGLRHIPELVQHWAPRLQLPATTVETYLTRNIHYRLDAPSLAGLQRFFSDAAELRLIPQAPALRLAGSPTLLEAPARR